MIIKFRYKLIFLVTVTLTLAAVAYVIVSLGLAKNIETDITDRLIKSNGTYEEFNNSYFEQLILQSRSVSDNPKFAAQLSTGDQKTVQQALEETNQIGEFKSDIFVALSPSGQVLAFVGTELSASMNLSQRPEVAAALEGYDNGGFWEENGKLLRVAASPTIVNNQVLGGIVLGYDVTDTVATKIAKVTTSSIAFIINGKIVATDKFDNRNELLAQFKSSQSFLDQAMIRKTSSDPFQFTIHGERYLAVAHPVFAATGSQGQERPVIATYVFFSSLDKALEPLVASQRTMVFVGGGVTILAFMIALVIISGVTKPVHQLSDAMHKVQSGDLNIMLQIKSRDEFGELGKNFNEMTQGLKQKERVENLFGKYLSPDVAKKVLSEQSVDGILKGEKNRLSVMFTDIRGFTPMSRGMDPQELINLLNSHFDEMIDIIDSYGGTLDKFIGDAIMAFYGAPVHYDDFYMRAINAAVQMQRAAEKFNFQRKLEGHPPINIGIGINTGEVVVGNIGSNKRLEYTVIGETVNIANRLCSVAKAGQIIVSQSTYDLLPNKSIASPIERVTLKGVAEPVTVYEILWKS
ncbi:MAG TPA: adenylate/guanylate cyclase domain-containing protein [bacterium]|nr:adenylate/guanylate cyclase domain-containing protein [bacterium]HMY35591.1 adenylate/guanylate cyclase domain-containing protein [bacterium]HMZ05487.1 adenylate/guanylate cyclase domain-containing protein [bacterium]HNC49374.1 adenylate/guanylate cyclase domain-containing protein [bacterium]HND76439.1 adenylate/guanylate cyclase domain-containing protein [bacterium]